jgi:hypothetical protein
MVGCSPNEDFRVEVVDELLIEFQERVEWHLRLETSGMRICDMILRPPSGWG